MEKIATEDRSLLAADSWPLERKATLPPSFFLREGIPSSTSAQSESSRTYALYWASLRPEEERNGLCGAGWRAFRARTNKRPG